MTHGSHVWSYIDIKVATLGQDLVRISLSKSGFKPLVILEKIWNVKSLRKRDGRRMPNDGNMTLKVSWAKNYISLC